MNPSETRLNRATMQKVQLQVIPWLSPHNRIWLNPFLIFFLYGFVCGCIWKISFSIRFFGITARGV